MNVNINLKIIGIVVGDTKVDDVELQITNEMDAEEIATYIAGVGEILTSLIKAQE